MRDHQFPSPAATRHHPSSPQAGSHRSAHPAITRRWLAAAALALSFLGPAVASACGTPANRDDCSFQKGISAAEIAFQDNLQPSQAAGDPPKTETPAVLPENNSLATRFGLALRASTLGLGADAVFRIARPVNVRVGFNSFHYTRNLRSDGVPYEGSLYLRSLQTVVDWFPFSHSFHVGTGALFFNGDRVTALATPPVGQVLTAGAQAYISDPQDPITGSAKSATRKIAPMVIMGFGNLVPRHRHFGYSVDVGVVFQGVPKSTFTVAGGACDPTGEFCARAAEDSSIQAEAQSARSDLARHVSFLKYYPVMSVEFGYRF